MEARSCRGVACVLSHARSYSQSQLLSLGLFGSVCGHLLYRQHCRLGQHNDGAEPRACRAVAFCYRPCLVMQFRCRPHVVEAWFPRPCGCPHPSIELAHLVYIMAVAWVPAIVGTSFGSEVPTCRPSFARLHALCGRTAHSVAWCGGRLGSWVWCACRGEVARAGQHHCNGLASNEQALVAHLPWRCWHWRRSRWVVGP